MAGIHLVAQVFLEFMATQSASVYWDYRHKSSCPANKVLLALKGGQQGQVPLPQNTYDCCQPHQDRSRGLQVPGCAEVQGTRRCRVYGGAGCTGCGVHGGAGVHGGVGCTEVRGEQRLGVYGGAEVHGGAGCTEV